MRGFETYFRKSVAAGAAVIASVGFIAAGCGSTEAAAKTGHHPAATAKMPKHHSNTNNHPIKNKTTPKHNDQPKGKESSGVTTKFIEQAKSLCLEKNSPVTKDVSKWIGLKTTYCAWSFDQTPGTPENPATNDLTMVWNSSPVSDTYPAPGQIAQIDIQTIDPRTLGGGDIKIDGMNCSESNLLTPNKQSSPYLPAKVLVCDSTDSKKPIRYSMSMGVGGVAAPLAARKAIMEEIINFENSHPA